MYKIFLPSVFCLALLACNSKETPKYYSTAPLFTLLPGSETGITFRNDLVYDKDFNIYKYRNFYNGGGVAIGDVNKDGLVDVFFTSNMGQNKLYLNRGLASGEMKFEDVTDAAGVGGRGSWSTGVAMADVNGDGWLDIYVCNSGNPRSDETKETFNRENELFINNGAQNSPSGVGGVATFTEKAREYGLADRGLSTHAAFFDYDKDGDLDMYMLNNSFRPISSFNLDKNLRQVRDSLGGHKLYQNQLAQTGKPEFKDVSVEAGIMGSEIAFGLGVTVGDVNLDGWQDIYVSNDFFEKDYFYINNGDGTFDEQLEKSFRHISAASMGADMADINNDCYPEIFVTDMLPDHDFRLKTATSFDSWDRFQYTKRVGYFDQFTRNMLHLNNSDGTFSDIACLAGVEATDWSWGALMFDMDNDGWKDIFVANGIAQDLTNQDYLQFIGDPTVQREIITNKGVDFKRLIDSIPSEPLANYAFQNQGNLNFKNRADDWGLSQKSFSNGSAYADLDNDGDLDLVVNNVNMEAFVYRNEADKLLKNNYLKFEIAGAAGNSGGIGAKIFLRNQGKTFYQEKMPMRGFESAVDPRPNFGLGEISKIDTVLVEFLSGKSIVLTNVKTNQTISISENDALLPAQPKPWLKPAGKPLLTDLTSTFSIPYKHQENNFTDWDRDRMLYFQYSKEGPRLAVADLNSDGLEDVFLCGAAGQGGQILIQKTGGKFMDLPQPAFQNDKKSEDVDVAFFDADGDGDPDLYVASGGNEFSPGQPELADRLYLNDGKGHFSKKNDALPQQKPFASGCVAPADVDGDGDTDVFVGMRLVPENVGAAVGGFLMLNDGRGFFTPSREPVLQNLGMVTDAVWSDLDGDGDPDLVVVGEWMPVKIFINNHGKLTDATVAAGLEKSAGLWKRIVPGDFNGDGKMDFLLGNCGKNTRLKASPDKPMSLFFNDFDENGKSEQFVARYVGDRLLPYNLRGDAVSNLPFLKKKMLHYRDYANKTIEEIFPPEKREKMQEMQAGWLESSVLMNLGGGKFELKPLSNEAQFSPIYGICPADLDGDGDLDAISGGNFSWNKPEMGSFDADYGLVLENDGRGNFTPKRSAATGFRVAGEVRDIVPVKLAGGKTVFWVARNNDGVVVFGK